jgi:universal stress protein A
MSAVNTILVPTDFSDASQEALRYACDVAAAFNASLHVLHVVENPFSPGALMEVAAPLPDDYVEGLERQARERLDSLMTPEQKGRFSAQLITRIGVPAHQILEYVKQQGGIDLIVMATAGRGGVARLMMGSVADKLVRSAPCPVLTIHPRDRGTGAGRYAA